MKVNKLLRLVEAIVRTVVCLAIKPETLFLVF